MKRKNAHVNGLPSFVTALGMALLLLYPSAYAQLDAGTQISITQDFLDAGSTKIARAFVETDSGSPLVVCSINENDPGFGALRLAGLVVLCRARTVEVEGNQLDGVGIAVIFPVLFDTTRGFNIVVTVFQDAATGYGDPIACPDC